MPREPLTSEGTVDPVRTAAASDSEAPAESRERLSASFLHAPVGLAHVAFDGAWLEVNPRLCRVLGYSRAELLQLRVQDIVHPADRSAALDGVRRVRDREIESHVVELRCVPKEGGQIWVEASLSRVSDGAGQHGYLIVVMHEISSRKRAEEVLIESARELALEVAERRRIESALRQSEAQSAAILQAALDCIVTVDRHGTIVEFNPAAERTFGYSREQAVGKSLAELLVPKALRQQHLDGFARYLSTGQSTILGKRIEIQSTRADGSEFPVELAVVSTTHQGEPGFAAYIRDISERREARRALEASEARFRHLTEAGIIGIMVTDTAGNIIEANDELLRIVGYDREDVSSGTLRWTDLTPQEWKFADRRALKQLEKTGVATPWEKEYVRKDGSRVPVVVGVAMLEPPRCIACVLDLTERRRAQEAGAEAVAVAERESADRERAEVQLARTEEQLRQSQKMEAIGTLSGSIAHDFNNLLSVILSYSDLLLQDLTPEDPVRADLEQIGLAARRANELTRQLLAFSRRQVLEPKIVNLNETIAGMAAMLRRVIGEDIELSLLTAPQLGTVSVDPGQMEQVLLNLIVNARDAMPRGGKLTIETAEADLDDQYAGEHLGVAAGRYVVLRVSDTGNGMDRATQSRIFEPFFTTKEQGKGTGLGLSTVFGIVKQSGGSIWVYSEVGVGTTLKVYLPRADGEAVVIDRSVAQTTALRGSETVLLVEDDEQVRRLASTILHRYGYRVIAAATGGDAVLVCEQYPETIHLLITDVVMPRMSGRQLWERLSPLRPSMKVLFMSGYTDDAIVHHGVLSSEFPFVQKPLLPPLLLAKLRAVLDG